MTKIIIKLT